MALLDVAANYVVESKKVDDAVDQGEKIVINEVSNHTSGGINKTNPLKRFSFCAGLDLCFHVMRRKLTMQNRSHPRNTQHEGMTESVKKVWYLIK